MYGIDYLRNELQGYGSHPGDPLIISDSALTTVAEAGDSPQPEPTAALAEKLPTIISNYLMQYGVGVVSLRQMEITDGGRGVIIWNSERSARIHYLTRMSHKVINMAIQAQLIEEGLIIPHAAQ